MQGGRQGSERVFQIRFIERGPHFIIEPVVPVLQIVGQDPDRATEFRDRSRGWDEVNAN